MQPTDLLVGLDERAHPLLVGGEPGRVRRRTLVQGRPPGQRLGGLAQFGALYLFGVPRVAWRYVGMVDAQMLSNSRYDVERWLRT